MSDLFDQPGLTAVFRDELLAAINDGWLKRQCGYLAHYDKGNTEELFAAAEEYLVRVAGEFDQNYGNPQTPSQKRGAWRAWAKWKILKAWGNSAAEWKRNPIGKAAYIGWNANAPDAGTAIRRSRDPDKKNDEDTSDTGSDNWLRHQQKGQGGYMMPKAKTVRGDAKAGEDWERDTMTMYRTTDDEAREDWRTQLGIPEGTDLANASAFRDLTDLQLAVAERIFNEYLSDAEIAEQLGMSRGDVAKIRTVVLPEKIKAAANAPRLDLPTLLQGGGGFSFGPHAPKDRVILRPQRYFLLYLPDGSIYQPCETCIQRRVDFIKRLSDPTQWVFPTRLDAERAAETWNGFEQLLGRQRPGYRWAWYRRNPGYGLRLRRTDDSSQRLRYAAEQYAKYGRHPRRIPKADIVTAYKQGARGADTYSCPYSQTAEPTKHAAWMTAFQEEQKLRRR